MSPKIKTKEFKLTIAFLIIVTTLATIGHYIQASILPKEIEQYGILNKNYLLVGFASVFLIITTYFIYLKAAKQLPMLYLSLTVFKLGLFITLFMQEDDLPMKVRVAFLIPIMTFLVIEKIYAFNLFKILEQPNNNSN